MTDETKAPKHTPEPWEARVSEVVTEGGRMIANCNTAYYQHNGVDNAARIVACVNSHDTLRATVAEQSGIITDQQNACVDMQQNEMRLTNTVAELVDAQIKAMEAVDLFIDDLKLDNKLPTLHERSAAAIAKAREVLGE